MADKVDISKTQAVITMPALKSNDAAWIKWSDLVIPRYGTDKGKQIFIEAWEKRGSRDANTRSIRTHLKDKYGIEIDESVWDKIVDVGGAIGDIGSKTMKIVKVVVIVAVVGAIAYYGFKIVAAAKAAKGGVRK